jgi:hypothetical protein
MKGLTIEECGRSVEFRRMRRGENPLFKNRAQAEDIATFR